MTTVLLLLGLLLAIGLSAVSSGSETGVYCLNRVRLRVACEQGEPAALRLGQLVQRRIRLVQHRNLCCRNHSCHSHSCHRTSCSNHDNMKTC